MIDLARWRPTPLRRLMVVAPFAALAIAGAPQAIAQSNIDLSTDNVTVDLSVIEGSGGPASSRPPYVTGGGTAPGSLKVPSTRAPVSELHVAVPRGDDSGRIKLRQPGAKKTPTKEKAAKPAAAKKKPAPPPTPKPAPAEPEVAAPASPDTPKAAVAEAPAPPPPAEPAVQEPETKQAAMPPPAPVPAAPPAPEAESPPAKAEQAAVTPPTETLAPGRAMRVAFQPAASKLPNDSKGGLKTLAEKLKGHDALRLQLMAYAGGSGVSASKARRLSLSRALSVRSFLIENGVRSTRIDVRALGSKTSEEPVNRVDVNIVER